MTQKQLEKLTKLWQKRLRLQDWEVSVEFGEMESSDIYGGCSFQKNFCSAQIRISDKLLGDLYQIEETLVHELLHIRFPHHNFMKSDLHAEGKLMEHEFEVGIDMIARALVEAYNA